MRWRRCMSLLCGLRAGDVCLRALRFLRSFVQEIQRLDRQSKDATFDGADFARNAFFRQVTFYGPASFINTKFHLTIFEDERFERQARFERAVFNRRTAGLRGVQRRRDRTPTDPRRRGRALERVRPRPTLPGNGGPGAARRGPYRPSSDRSPNVAGVARVPLHDSSAGTRTASGRPSQCVRAETRRYWMAPAGMPPRHSPPGWEGPARC